LGVRTSNCDALSLSLTDENSTLHKPTLELVKQIDFINCQKLPATSGNNVSKEVGIITDHFLNVRKEFSKNKNLTVIGETGWPSYDTGNGQYTSIKLVQFWIEMGGWAQSNKYRVDMFTAFDEPWKITLGKGVHESHFGWWKRIRNDSNGEKAFQEKIDYVQIQPSVDYTLEIVLGILGSLIFVMMLSGMLYLYKTLILVKVRV
jgi:hypothetical protein